jgi:outer membrane protein OmpA-like peptidoglycan-associated protein
MLSNIALAVAVAYPSAFGPSGYYDVVSPFVMERFENRASLTIGAYLGYIEGTFWQYEGWGGASEVEDFAYGRVGVCYTPSDWFEIFSLLRGIEWWPGASSQSIGGFSDADLGLKIRLFKAGMLTTGIMGVVTLPTGERQTAPIVIGGDSLGTYAITDSQLIYGGSVLAELDFGKIHDLTAFRLCLNAGYYTGGGYVPAGRIEEREDPLRIGTAFILSSRYMDYIVEAKYFGRTDMKDKAFVTPAFRFRPFEGVGLSLLGGVNLNTTYYIPENHYEWNYDVVAGIGLITPLFKTEELMPGGGVMGKVFDSRTKEPLKAKVKVVEANMSLESDTNGIIRIKHLPEGIYTLVAEKDGYRKTYSLVNIKRRTQNMVELPMDPAAVLIKGIVIDSLTSGVVEGAKVAFAGPESKEVTSGSSEFELSLKPGAYWVSASKEGYFTKYMDLALYEPKFVKIVIGRPMVREPKLIETVNFATASAVLSSEAKAKLDKVGKILKDDPASIIVITGHTDKHGSVFYNELLSEKRAKAVKDYLASKYDIPDERMRVDWYSEFQKAGSSDSGNRRVEIYLLQPVEAEKAKPEEKPKEGQGEKEQPKEGGK